MKNKILDKGQNPKDDHSLICLILVVLVIFLAAVFAAFKLRIYYSTPPTTEFIIKPVEGVTCLHKVLARSESVNCWKD